jgi:hypothetical protein
MEAGFDAHLVKPPSIDSLSRVLSRCTPQALDPDGDISAVSSVNQNHA